MVAHLSQSRMKSGLLTIVGVGIKIAAHMTVEAEIAIREADRVLYLTYWPETSAWVEQLNPHAHDLAALYATGKQRHDTYQEMVAQILSFVRQGESVCAVFYGHPGVFVTPTHAAIRQARAEGFAAEMLAGISAEDCLYADFGLDPARSGCQTYEATDFLIRPRHIDTHTPLILWQIGVIGHMTAPESGRAAPNLAILIDRLTALYDADHAVYVYEAAQYPNQAPSIQQAPLRYLPNAHITPLSTLYIPPQSTPAVDHAMVAQLGLTLVDL